jgi:hypothetical protein
MSEQPATSKSPKTLTDHLKAFGGALLLVLVTLLLLEGLLRMTDPWGLEYFDDLLKFGNEIAVADAQRDFIMPDGVYRFSDWTVTIADGQRVIPANHADAACTIGLLGDSVLFGFGVSDDETVPQHLAEQFPYVNFLNLSLIGYNSINIVHTYEAFPDADGYLYLIFGNDDSPPLMVEGDMFVSSGGENLPHLVRYVQFVIYDQKHSDFRGDPHTNAGDSPNILAMLDDMDTLGADERMYFVTFDVYQTYIQLLEERGHRIAAVPYPLQSNSVVDAHPNPEGTQELANSLAPIVQEIVAAHCTD